VLVLLLYDDESRVRGALASLAGALAASAVVVAPFAASGVLDDLRWSLFTYNGDYASGGFDNLADRSLDDQLAWLFNAPGSPFVVAALALGALAWVLGRHRRLVAIGASWVLLEYVGAKAGVRDFSHYFVPLLPGCAILICAGADALAAQLTGIDGRARGVLALTVWLTAAFYLVIDGALVRIGGPADAQVTMSNQAADAVRDVTAPGDPIFVAANHDGFQVYWLADRNPPFRFFWPEVMGAPPYEIDASFTAQAEEMLRRDPPAAIVIWPGSLAQTDNYVQPAIERGGLRLIETVDDPQTDQNVLIYAR
jgi:hypothetical protein